MWPGQARDSADPVGSGLQARADARQRAAIVSVPPVPPHADDPAQATAEGPLQRARAGATVCADEARDALTKVSGLSPGDPWPLGVHVCCDGTNFALFSRQASAVELWVFDSPADRSPSRRIELDPRQHRTGDVWHVRLGEDSCGECYAFRVTSPGSRESSDSEPLLLDPMSPLVVLRAGNAGPTGATNSQSRHGFAGVVVRQEFDWQGVSPPQRPWGESVLYETHVRGLTRDDSARVEHAGQYLGVVEKIPYLKSLGITALELLPVQAFDAGPSAHGAQMRPGYRQYWGYNPIALFSPHPGYASGATFDSPIAELKSMVRELHRAGIEVILDVVFNHTGEGGRDGPTYSFRGLDNAIYYLLTPDGSDYLDYTGCGNTLNCNHPVVRQMILACLRHWVIHFHIDGFRFDLASVLGRGEDGAMLANPPLLEEIAEDPLLRDVKLIAEAWDSGGAFQVGRFPGMRWGEWNSRFRDDVRRFWRGDPGFTGALASRLCGSADLYERGAQTPVKSINLITSHDGFTLYDLVSYAGKHNEMNGEGNRDGLDENFSANYGVEGPTSDASINALRSRQMKNLLATLLLSRGVPMLLGGDELARTQHGNNNAYCQDNGTSWYDWSLAQVNAGLVRFVRELIRLRMSHPVLRSERFYAPREIEWLGAFGHSPEWHGPANRLGCIVQSGAGALALLFNATPELCAFDLTSSRLVARGEQSCWRLRIDTAREAPADAPEEIAAPVLQPSAAAQVMPHSLVVLHTIDG